MRDVKRIDETLTTIEKYWKQFPDWRLGQLLTNIFHNEDIFYLEDDVFKKRVINFFDGENITDDF